ncbi:MAG: hypothetical protein JWN03_8196 [Nocardia sp.]|nr:hypothetical protein [Nocardia sp.]
MVQGRAEDNAHRLLEIDEPDDLRIVPNTFRITEIRLDHRGGLVIGEQRPPVRQHDRIIVDVHHPGIGNQLLRDLVHIVGRRQSSRVSDIPANASDSAQAGAAGVDVFRDEGGDAVGRLQHGDVTHIVNQNTVSGVREFL